jgi:hypothetical protein
MQEWLYEGEGKWDRGINKAIILMSLQPGVLYTDPHVPMDSMWTHVESTLSLHGLHEDSMRTWCGLHEDSMDFRGSPWLYFLQST